MAIGAKQHDVACSNRDYDFFYNGLEDGKILVQRCEQCGRLRNPPSPMCPHCQSVGWVAEAMSGAGTIFSFTIHRYPPIPGFEMPHPVGVVCLDEGVRLVAGLQAISIDSIRIGLRVQAEFYRRGDFASLRFRCASLRNEQS